MSSIPKPVPPLAPGQRMNVGEFMRRWEAMPELKFAELIEGVVYMPSPMKTDSGRMELRVGGWLYTYMVATPGSDAGSQATWLMLSSAPQPDSYLWILPECGGQSGMKGEYHAGAPELAAEVCLSSKVYDLGEKKELYRKGGVQEYVAVLLKEREIRWHRLVNKAYELRPPSKAGIYRSEMFPGLWLDGPSLLRDDLARVLKLLQRGLKSKAHAAFVADLAARKG